MNRVLARRTAPLALLAAVGSLAVGLALAATDSSNPVRFADSTESPVANSLRGSTPTEKLDAIRARMGARNLVVAEVGAAPERFDPTDGTVPPPPEFANAKWAYLTTRAPEYTWRALRSIWEADLAIGALRDAMAADGEVLYSARISVQLPNGQIASVPGGIGKVAAHQRFAPPEDPEAAVRAAAASLGLEVTSAEVLTADQAAPAVTVRTNDPAQFIARSHEIVSALFGEPLLYEGYYLRAEDQNGEAVFVRATSFRSGAGREWIRPDLNPRLDS